MIDIDKIIDALGVDRESVLRFFAFFSRFEYSLKRSGFLKGQGNKANPDWDKYAKSLEGRFGKVQDPEFRNAVTFLLNQPPKIQVVSCNGLGWRDSVKDEGECHECHVLRLVRTVRNNLFHGGKYLHGPLDDAARNRELLVAAITVLSHCLELSDPRVRDTFEKA